MQLLSTAVAFWKTLCRTGSWARDTVPNCSYKWLRTVSLGDKAWARCKQNTSAPVLQGNECWKLPSPLPAPIAQPREPVGHLGAGAGHSKVQTQPWGWCPRVSPPGAARPAAGQAAARSGAPAGLCCTLGFCKKVGILEFGIVRAKSRRKPKSCSRAAASALRVQPQPCPPSPAAGAVLPAPRPPSVCPSRCPFSLLAASSGRTISSRLMVTALASVLKSMVPISAWPGRRCCRRGAAASAAQPWHGERAPAPRGPGPASCTIGALPKPTLMKRLQVTFERKSQEGSVS